jgi:hypothetical protein
MKTEKRPAYIVADFWRWRTPWAKRLLVLLSVDWRCPLGLQWIDEVGEFAAVVWRGCRAR